MLANLIYFTIILRKGGTDKGDISITGVFAFNKIYPRLPNKAIS